MSTMNRMHNIRNPGQGTAKKVLTICSAGILRSPTAAIVLAGDPYNYNTRAAGITDEYALIKVDEVLVAWADEIICMEAWQAQELEQRFQYDVANTRIVVLEIPDNFVRMAPALVTLIRERYGPPQ
jgi:predicted protein tyrosine phosphatase